MTTLQEAARALADALGGFLLCTVTEAPVSTDPDARRTIISSELVDEDRDPTSFNDHVVFCADGPLAGQQQAVRRDLYDGTAGRLVTSGQFTAAPQPGQVVELHARLPRQRHFGEPGLREVINEGLNRLWFPDELLLTGTAASTTYPAPSWLFSNKQIVGVKLGGGVGIGVNPAFTPITATLLHDRTGLWVQLSQSLSPGTPFRVVARRPYASWIKAGGTWGDSTAGLVDDDDETLCDLEALLVVATWRAYHALARRSPDFETGPWRGEKRAAEVKAAALIQWGGTTASPLGPPAPMLSGWSKNWEPG